MSNECSQSTILGRSGSNACTFIALYFGHLYFAAHLKPPSNKELSNEWKVCLRQALIKGNDIHDDIFENEPVNVTVGEAIEIAGNECCVKEIGQQLDAFGQDVIDQLASAFEQFSHQRPSCVVVVVGDRSVLFLTNSDVSSMIVDSHHHVYYGALISYVQPGSQRYLANWLDSMFRLTWNSALRLVSLTPVVYID